MCLLYNLFFTTSKQVICKVSYASLVDVDKAVAAAKEAFENGEWGRMNARDRGRLMYRWVCVFSEIQGDFSSAGSLPEAPQPAGVGQANGTTPNSAWVFHKDVRDTPAKSANEKEKQDLLVQNLENNTGGGGFQVRI